MTSLATPHGLAVAGALFMLSGLAILGAALLNRTTLATLKTSFDTPAKLGVAAGFALPMLAFGLFLQAAGNMVDVSMGPGLTALLLALAFGLVLYATMDETIADALERRAVRPAATTAAQAPAAAATSLPAPVRDAITDAGKAEPSKAAAADAPKIALVS